MIINNKSDLKIYETNLSHYKDNKLETGDKKTDNEKDIKKDKNSNINLGVYNDIRIQVNSMDYQQRNIQEKISLIQSEELKISQIENSLEQAKKVYMQAINNESKENSKYKNAIKDFVKQIDDIKKDFQGDDDREHKENKTDYIYLDKDTADYKTIDIINNTLREITSIKTKLSESKSNLIALEQMIEGVKSKIKNKESYTKDYLDIIKYTKEIVLTNPYKYMNSQNNIISDIVIDILK